MPSHQNALDLRNGKQAGLDPGHQIFSEGVYQPASQSNLYSIAGFNLLHASHVEAYNIPTMAIPRSVYARLRVRF